jgi:hypothetical protein
MMSNLPTILNEIDSIQDTMRSNPQAYFKNEPMQARYRQLVEQKGGSSSSSLEESSEPLVPVLRQSEYQAQGGPPEYYGEYLKLTRQLADWAMAMPAADQRSFVDSFNCLPLKVQLAAVQEIRSPTPLVEPRSDKALAAFGEVPEGAVLMREWGHLSGRNLARVRERLFRVIDRLPENLAASFLKWVDGLSTNCAIALWRRLAV